MEFTKLVVAQLAEHIEPLDRGAIYEDPLAMALEKLGLGTVTGGGTPIGDIGDDGRIPFVEIELTLADTGKALDTAIGMLEALGAPLGSCCLWTDGNGTEQRRVIGRSHGFALWLDGVNLEPSVYEACGLGELSELILTALDGGTAGRAHGSFMGERETALFIYGPDRDRVRKALEEIQQRYPLCKNSRLEDIPIPNLT